MTARAEFRVEVFGACLLTERVATKNRFKVSPDGSESSVAEEDGMLRLARYSASIQ